MNSPLATILARALVLDDRLLADTLAGGAVDDLIANIIDEALCPIRIKMGCTLSLNPKVYDLLTIPSEPITALVN